MTGPYDLFGAQDPPESADAPDRSGSSEPGRDGSDDAEQDRVGSGVELHDGSPGALGVDAQPGDNPVDNPPAGDVFGRRSRMVLARETPPEGFVDDEARLCVVMAIGERHEIVPHSLEQEWQTVPEAELRQTIQVDRADPKWLVPDDTSATLEEMSERRAAKMREADAEEARRTAVYTGARWLVTRIRTRAPGHEKPAGPALPPAAKEEILRRGHEALATQDAGGLICGGALRRHSFAPNATEWLRAGTIGKARCNDCGRMVEREELLNLATAEGIHGTCETCGGVALTISPDPAPVIVPNLDRPIADLPAGTIPRTAV
jgi:hypothetical protein